LLKFAITRRAAQQIVTRAAIKRKAFLERKVLQIKVIGDCWGIH